MRGTIVGTLVGFVLGQLLDTLKTETVTTGQGKRLLVIVIVRLEADAALKDGINHTYKSVAYL